MPLDVREHEPAHVRCVEARGIVADRVEQRLGHSRRMGDRRFGEAALVTKVSGDTTILCQVNGTRLALSHAAAMNILVEQLPESAR